MYFYDFSVTESAFTLFLWKLAIFWHIKNKIIGNLVLQKRMYYKGKIKTK